MHLRASIKLILLLALLLLTGTFAGYCDSPPLPERPGLATPTPATISGRVVVGEKIPMANGFVMLHDRASGPPPHPYKYWRIPDAIFPANQDGTFSIPVPAGTYYIMIAQKNATDEIGPPKKSEALYFHGDKTGNPLPLSVTAGTHLDLGQLTATLWSPDQILRDKEITAIEGVVTDQDGAPVANAVVFASYSKGTTGRPTFVSERTDHNGRYLLRVSEGGTYYLKVRSVLGGGPPKAGEFLNTTKGFEPTMVTLAKDQIKKGVSLKVKKFARPTGATGNEQRELGKPVNGDGR